mgnify:CR=1 FL=1
MKKLLLITLPLYMAAGNLSVLLDNTIENKLVESSIYNVESVKKQYESVKGNYKPQISIGTTYSTTNEETAAIADSSFVSYGKIDYVIYDGGAKENIYDSMESNINSAKQSLVSLKNKLALEVINLYYNYLSLKASKKATLQEIKTLSAQQNRLEQFLKAGTTTSDEVEKIISRVQSAHVTLSQIELDMTTLVHKLKYLTNKDSMVEEGSIINFNKSDKTLKRADIKSLEASTKALKQNALASKGAKYPTLTLKNTFYKYDMNYENTAYESDVDNQNVLKLNLNWKIYDFGATDDTFDSNHKKYLSSKSNLEYEKIKSNVDLDLAKKSYEIAKLQIKSASLALKAANATYESIESKYQNGLVENVSYLEALSEKSAALSQLERAKNDLEIKKANILYHSGLNVWEYAK